MNQLGTTRCGSTEFRWGERTYVMGVVNVSPDSFSGDGIIDPEVALAQAHRFVSEGADILDVGGESTRPGAAPADRCRQLPHLPHRLQVEGDDVRAGPAEGQEAGTQACRRPETVEKREVGRTCAEVEALGPGLGGQYAEVLLPGAFDPGFGRIRIGPQQFQIGFEQRELVIELAGDFAQRVLGFHQQAEGADFLADRQVVASLGRLDVGNRDQAHLEALRGLLQLAPDGALLGFGELQVILGVQHIEVALGHLHHQFLLGSGILGFGARDFAVGLLELNPAVVAEQRLDQIEAGDLAGDVIDRLEKVLHRACVVILLVEEFLQRLPDRLAKRFSGKFAARRPDGAGGFGHLPGAETPVETGEDLAPGEIGYGIGQRARLRRDLDERAVAVAELGIEQELDDYLNQLRVDPSVVEPFYTRIQGYITRPGDPNRTVSDEVRDLPSGVHDVQTAEGIYKTAIRKEDDLWAFLIYDVSENQRIKRLLVFLLVGVVALFSVFSFMLGASASKRVMKPVTDLAARLDTLSEEGKPERLSQHFADDEVQLCTLLSVKTGGCNRDCSVNG